MRRILGLDITTTSIGWALVNEAENEHEKSSIIKLGVRVIPLSVEEEKSFTEGKDIATNSDRTEKRNARKYLHRYKLRRKALEDILVEHKIISNDTVLCEDGPNSTYQSLKLRSKAAKEEVSLEEFARVLFMINKKRGYKSNRKAKSDEEDGNAVNNIQLAEYLEHNNLTPGQYVYDNRNKFRGKRRLLVPSFYRSDLQSEFDKIYESQKQHYPELLTQKLYDELQEKGMRATWAICKEPFNLEGLNRMIKGCERDIETYSWRVKALSEKLGLEELAIVFQEINNQLKQAGGYLGDISDRSKELYINDITIGEYLLRVIKKNPNDSIKNKVFYRQDYIDEFETIWNCQQQYHPELSEKFRKIVRDRIIFYQRPLKSRKGLIDFCEFESKQITVKLDGKDREITVGPRVCPKSSPLFQEFRIWQNLNNLTIGGKAISDEDKKLLHNELSYKKELNKQDVKRILGLKEVPSINYEKLEGNRTMATLCEAFSKMIILTGHDEYDFSKSSMTYDKAKSVLSEIFKLEGWDTGLLSFDCSLTGKEYEEQPLFVLWHMLYSYEGDSSKSGYDKLIEKIKEKFGIDKQYAQFLAKITFEPDYGNLSTKAMKKILPYMQNDGLKYSDACEKAGYRHSSSSLTKDERDAKVYKNRLEEIPKNSLRNPVVEKILNQMVNVVNAVIDEYGKPDEIRIELARVLKKSKKERSNLSREIYGDTIEDEKIRRILKDAFHITYPTRNDITRYKLYKELEFNGYKTLYSGTQIKKEELFSDKYDIDHIIPKSLLFDDSISNKTLELRSVNISKGGSTAYDYVKHEYGDDAIINYKLCVEHFYREGLINYTKKKYLLATFDDVPGYVLAKEIRNSKHIVSKLNEMLVEVSPVVLFTSGKVTSRLKNDWGLTDVLKELNWDKYNRVGLTRGIEVGSRKIDKDIIANWSNRNDYRYSAVDALVVAFTRPAYLHYLNNLFDRTGRRDVADSVFALEKKYLTRHYGKLCFIVPHFEEHSRTLSLESDFATSYSALVEVFRDSVKESLQNVLASFKPRNKVMTRNVNVTKAAKGKLNRKIQLTPRGRLHAETVYGKSYVYKTIYQTVGSKMDEEAIANVASKKYREALLARLKEFGGDAKKAFTGKNSLKKNPIYLDSLQMEKVPGKVKLVALEPKYTVRKPVDEHLNVSKVLNDGIRRLLEARLSEYGDKKRAFSNLEDNPIWYNKEKGFVLKRVTVEGPSVVYPLHNKKDHFGELILDEKGQPIPNDYVTLGNNHHVAIYEDERGNLQEEVVSFMEAVQRVNLGYPIVFKDFKKNEGWKFLFSMKQNEMFVFPNEETGFDPAKVDLMDKSNYSLISPNLFRVQKFTTKDYFFRHHLETELIDTKELRDVTWKRIFTPNNLKGVVKVRLNSIGEIVQVDLHD